MKTAVIDTGLLRHSPMQIFSESRLSEILEARKQSLLKDIETEQPNKLLNSNESDYVGYLAKKYHIDRITFHFEALQVSHSEKLIPIERHPFNSGARFSYSQQSAYPRQVITFHLPFTGDGSLLRYQPSTHLMWSTEISVSSDEIHFDIINWQNDTATLKQEQNDIICKIRQQNDYVTGEVEHYNSGLDAQARFALSERKALLLKQASTVESLGIPLRKASDVVQTFSVPIVPKKLLVKPVSSETAYAPQPTLDHETYQNILTILHEMGVAMERNPSTYAAKHEEDLRDFFLMTLGTHYPNATGETFNKNGKTDILVRHDGTNIFVGECKFWKGIKGFHETIDQILGYLTWRDSKAAILCFVNNKELNPVLDQIATCTPQHPCFIRQEGKKAESWIQFEFRLKSDPTRNVHLAVLCFHFPAE